jgi:hypothetical protein
MARPPEVKTNHLLSILILHLPLESVPVGSEGFTHGPKDGLSQDRYHL